MKVYQTNEIKNIALLGNDGSGKTTLTEALLFESGIIKRRGRITAKNTVSDYFPVEQEYGYSVFSTVYHVEWNGKKLNIIDCPGSDDFVGAASTDLRLVHKITSVTPRSWVNRLSSLLTSLIRLTAILTKYSNS